MTLTAMLVDDEVFREALRERAEKVNILNEVAEFSILGSRFVRLPSHEYALMCGKEFIEHCCVKGFCGQAFTDRPKECKMKVKDVIDLNLNYVDNRALFFSLLNAVMCYCREIRGAIHCVGKEAEKCGERMAMDILMKYGKIRVAHIGYQPGHIKALSKVFKELYVTDMNPENVGKNRFGVVIINSSMNEEIISKVDLVLITGSSIVNGTLPQLLNWCEKYDVMYWLYGVTAIGVAKLLGLKVFCPFSHQNIPKMLGNIE